MKHLEKSDCINYIHCWGPCEHRVGLNVYSLNREMVVPLVNLSDVVSDQIRSVAQSCPTLCDPIDYRAFQAPLSVGFSRQEYWRMVGAGHQVLWQPKYAVPSLLALVFGMGQCLSPQQ